MHAAFPFGVDAYFRRRQTKSRARRKVSRRPVIEALERREMFWADLIASADGSNVSCSCGCGDVQVTNGGDAKLNAGNNPLNQTYNSGADMHPLVKFEAELNVMGTENGSELLNK